MNKKRCNLAKWPIEVYDYERKVITDVAVGGIDLRRGCWIHCKWCNTTLKTTSFSLVCWKSHTKTKTHLVREQKTEDGGSQVQVISSLSQSSMQSLQENEMSVVEGQAHEDYEPLMFVRESLHKNKQHQARHEQDVSNVINAMTNLITDQQSDLDVLQNKVHDMKHEIQELKKDLEFFHRKKTSQKILRAAPQQMMTPSTLFTTLHSPKSQSFTGQTESHYNNGAWIKSYTNNVSAKSKTMKRSTSDMDTFEKRFRLTGHR